MDVMGSSNSDVGHIIERLWDNLCELNQSTLVHPYEFFVWKKSMKFRFYIGAAFTFIMTVTFQFYISNYNK